ncbi:MBL fold metallo-hydrolase [Streptomyces sp. MST-110588]|uniref:MBL fold metallo-hydrolase n=1 Tax=Streptomyces sp. MST-110588 TaxID=2833628 RepID=UPI001F5C73C0|nr:MBL fold metallo-hydrolase [Streptomyces sp. MST-110588]
MTILTRLTRQADIRTIRFGDAKLSYVPDGYVGLKPRGWFPEASDADWETYREYIGPDGYLMASIGALLVERDGRAILIDAGAGAETIRMDPDHPHVGDLHSGALVDSLARLGRTPAEIESIAITHLHLDHIGWATEPAFAGAEIVMSEQEWAGRAVSVHHGTSEAALAVMEPRLRTASDGEEIFPGVRVLATPGHTPGHAAYEIAGDEGRRVIFFGDAMHSSIQINHPDWHSGSDDERPLAAKSRHALLAELTKPGTLGFGVHFADIQFGHVRRSDTGLSWNPLND